MMRLALRRAALVAEASFLAFVGAYYVKALDELDAVADDNSALSYSDRRIAGGNSVVVDQDAALEAEVLIPKTATYRVRISAAVGALNSLTPTFGESWFRYFLMPRRPAKDASWVICYRCDTARLDPAVVRWRDRMGISIIESR